METWFDPSWLKLNWETSLQVNAITAPGKSMLGAVLGLIEVLTTPKEALRWNRMRNVQVKRSEC